MSDVRVAHHRTNRAVAVLSEATSHTPTLIPSLSQVSNVHRPVLRFRQFSDLESARRQRCPLIGIRQTLADMQEKPKPRDELAVTPDAAIALVFDYLGLLSPDSAALAATCSRAQLLSLCKWKASVVDVVPAMLSSPAALARPGVMRSLTGYLATNKRGHSVESLSLVQSGFAAVQPPKAAASTPVLRLPQVLQLVAQLTFLQSLDLRGVSWGEQPGSQAAVCFLADLHLVAPRLQCLKVGAELCRHWTPGWWQRQPDLNVLVVGSRTHEAACSAASPATATATPATATAPLPGSASPPLRLDADFFQMLSSEQRPWRVKLWSRLARESMLRLLGVPIVAGPATAGGALGAGSGPSAAQSAAASAANGNAAAVVPPSVFPTLTELCINLQGNTDVCGLLVESDSAAAGGADGSGPGALGAGDAAAARQQLGQQGQPPPQQQQQSLPQNQPPRAKGKRYVPTEAVGDTPLFPALTTLTVANVEERVLSVAEALGRFYVLAPAITNVNVCNTMRLPPPEKPKGSRKQKTAAS